MKYNSLSSIFWSIFSEFVGVVHVFVTWKTGGEDDGKQLP